MERREGGWPQQREQNDVVGVCAEGLGSSEQLGYLCKMAVRVWTRSSLFGSLFRPNTIRKCTKTTKFDPHECVIVRQAAAATTVPAMSPFPIKLETYLRLANIPYKNRFGGAMSTKGKIPWIQYKDDVIADSNFCIKYLNEKFSVDLDADLSRSEKGIARSMMTMLEENTYW